MCSNSFVFEGVETEFNHEREVEKRYANFQSGSCTYGVDVWQLAKQYRDLNHGSINEFSLNFSFGWHALNQQLDDADSKELLFLLVKKYLTELQRESQL